MQILHRYHLHLADTAILYALFIALWTCAIVSFSEYSTLAGTDRLAPWLTILLSVVLALVLVLYVPRYLIITPELLIVRTSLKATRIPLRSIASIEPFRGGNFRTSSNFGIKGVQMCIGRCAIPRLGSVHFYTTHRRARVMITTTSGRRFVVNGPLDTLRDHPYIRRASNV